MIIQWSKFTNPASQNIQFPISFTDYDSIAMACSFSGNNQDWVYYNDFPHVVDASHWITFHSREQNKGYYIAIGY